MDPFKLLGISPDSTDEEIKAAYRRCAKEWHPDLNPSAHSGEMLKNINSAYDLIKTRDKKISFLKERFDGSDRRARVYNAEDAIKFKKGHRSLLNFERLVHPYTLMILLPSLGLAYFCLSSATKENATPKEITVNAWYNSKSQRWETPQPWREEFRTSGGVVTQVDRRKVHSVTEGPAK